MLYNMLYKHEKRGEINMYNVQYICGGSAPQSAHRAAIADFWRTFHHDENIIPEAKIISSVFRLEVSVWIS
jgi:hypothetical protein